MSPLKHKVLTTAQLSAAVSQTTTWLPLSLLQPCWKSLTGDTAQWEEGVAKKTKLFTTIASRLAMICVQYIDVHHLPPSFKFFSLLCVPPVSCLFLLPPTLPTSFLLPSLSSSPPLLQRWTVICCFIFSSLFTHLSVCFLFKLYMLFPVTLWYTHTCYVTHLPIPLQLSRRRR